VDVGHREEDIRSWLARQRQWCAVRGVGEDKADRMQTTGERVDGGTHDLAEVMHVRRQPSTGWITYWVVTRAVRKMAQDAFLVPPDKPGAAHLPTGVKGSDIYLKHLCSRWLIERNGRRVWSEKPADREFHREWQPRCDLLDCRTYVEALARWHYNRTSRTKPRRKYGDVAALAA
jgi:hypothetical protein